MISDLLYSASREKNENVSIKSLMNAFYAFMNKFKTSLKLYKMFIIRNLLT